jgi:hypothetical protein
MPGPGRHKQRRRVILVPHPLGQLDHVVPALGLGVELRERDSRVGRRLKLLDNVDCSTEVAVVLLQLRERKADGVTVDRQFGGDALGERELKPGEEVAGDEFVLGRGSAPWSSRLHPVLRS